MNLKLPPFENHKCCNIAFLNTPNFEISGPPPDVIVIDNTFYPVLTSIMILVLSEITRRGEKKIHEIGIITLPKLEIYHSYPLYYLKFLVSGPAPCPHSV